MLTKRTPEANRLARERFRPVRSEGEFTPPSSEGTVIFPSFDGGGEWGGSAFDPETGLLNVNSNEMAFILKIIERPKSEGRVSGRTLYSQNCAACHREDFRGTPPTFPSLVGISEKYSANEIFAISREGSGRMPGFAHLGDPAIWAIASYVTSGRDTELESAAGSSPVLGLKYTFDGYNKFLDPDGYPAIEPPWGTLNAINLDAGEVAWKIPFGEIPSLVAQGARNTGS